MHASEEKAMGWCTAQCKESHNFELACLKKSLGRLLTFWFSTLYVSTIYSDHLFLRRLLPFPVVSVLPPPPRSLHPAYVEVHTFKERTFFHVICPQNITSLLLVLVSWYSLLSCIKYLLCQLLRSWLLARRAFNQLATSKRDLTITIVLLLYSFTVESLLLLLAE